MAHVDATCLCGNNKPFTKCCSRFLDGSQHAKTPEQLMRSRYAAYALGGYGDYLLQTWFPATAHGLVAAELSERSHNWCKLDVLDKSQAGNNGEVIFRAHYCEADGTTGVMQECSAFKRLGGRWYYVDGRVS
jgi:SEC-C motif-containing protein